jgi:DNA-binding response OmpR family regulator
MKKILFVEDEESLQRAFEDMLPANTYEVIKALNGELGVKSAREYKPDIILLDLILPKKDGFEVLEELKNDEETKNIPVIVLTNLEGSADIERALGLGATTYLVKANYTIDDLMSKIEKALDDNDSNKDEN